MTAIALREVLPPWRVRLLAAWGLAFVLGAMAFRLADTSYRVLPTPRPLEELSYYPSGRHLAPATLGHSELAADLAWLRSVQYYGEHRASDNRFTHMAKVFDILTTLSPHFISPYVFGGFALAQEGRNFPAAEALMLKGIEANPTSGRLAFELGFLYFVRPGGRDFRDAAAFFEQASRQADGPPQSARFAAFARQSAGDLRIALELWDDVARTSTNLYLREMAQRESDRIRDAIARGRAAQAIRSLPVPAVRLVP